MARRVMASRVFHPLAFDGWALANHMAASIVTRRLSLVGTSQFRMNCVGTSAQRMATLGTSLQRITALGSSPQ